MWEKLGFTQSPSLQVSQSPDPEVPKSSTPLATKPVDRSKVNTSANSVDFDRLELLVVVESLIPSIDDPEPRRTIDRDLDSLNERERTHGQLELASQQVRVCPHRPKLWLGWY